LVTAPFASVCLGVGTPVLACCTFLVVVESVENESPQKDESMDTKKTVSQAYEVRISTKILGVNWPLVAVASLDTSNWDLYKTLTTAVGYSLASL
jgi:hypothetical protein